MMLPIFLLILVQNGYAWSGYGSNVLSNLRDAVVMAEKVFGDVMEKVIDVAHKVKSVHDTLDLSVEEECSFSCPEGGKAVPNKYHKPTANGCGPINMEIEVPYPEMNKCCNEHDICYSTCNKDKDACDLYFKKCLYKVCESVPGEDLMNVKGCKASAKILYTGTTALGCKFYKDSQKEACYCSQKKKKRMPGEL